MKTLNYIINDDRTPEEITNTIGFVVATDNFMSGWGNAQGRSIVAVPFVSEEDCKKIMNRMELRREMKRVREIWSNEYKPRLYEGDHLHIYDTTTSFRYSL